MRLIALLSVLAALALAGAATAEAPNASATGGSHLTVHNVFGLQTLTLQSFGFNARQTHGQASGWFTYHEIDDGAPFTVDGPVTCLTVIGRDAWIGATIEHSNDPTTLGLGAWWHVTDNGEGAGAPADITTFLGIGTAQQTQDFCAGAPAYKHPFAIDGGNIQVRG